MTQPLRHAKPLVVFAMLLCSCFSACNSQPQFGAGLLHLERKIPLPNVRGRIDHMDVNLKSEVIYVAALGSNTLEVVSLLTDRVVNSIKGLAEPQGVAFIPQHDEIFVANGGSGDCFFYNATSFEKVAAIHLSSDADDVRYDSSEHKIYVGYGSGGIAVIDADTHRQTGNVALPAHPEGFQLDKKLNRLFANVPDANMIAVVDLEKMVLIDQWKRNSPRANFPMAVDTAGHKLFVGYRHPAKLMVFDASSGKELSASPIAGDVDDLYYDAEKSRILVSGGDGHISILQKEARDYFKQIANISTSNGARTSLFIPKLRLFVVAARAAGGDAAALYVYRL